MSLSNNKFFFESVLAQLPCNIVVLNLDHQYIYVNPYAIQSAEMRKWIIGKTDFEYCEYRNIDINLATKRHEIFNKVVADKQELEFEEVITDKSGEVRYYSRRLTPIFSDFGEISFVIGYGLEITERKKMLIELETRSVFINKVLNTSPNLIYVKDGEGRFQLVNQAMANLFNTNIESLINKSNEEVHQIKDETDSYSIIDQKVINTLKPINIVEPLTKYDGTKLWFDTIKVPLIDSNGTVNVLGISTDITEKWLVAEKERENNLRLIAGEEITKSGNWEIDYESGEIYWSPGMYVIWERDEELGLPTIDESYLVMHPEDAVKLRTGIAEIKVSGKEFRMELRLLLPTGIKFLDSITKPILDDNNKCVKIVGSIIDVTDRKKHEYDLVQANKQADESVKAQEHFLANVTHELRTPINGVIGMARLLNKTDLSTTQRNYLDILSKTADNLLLIINDILDTAKIESGNLSFEKIVFDPSQVADTVVQTQLYKAEEKDLFIRHIVGMSTLPHVIGDPFRLNQILLNLLSNAIKFTQQGEVLLTHRVVEEQGENVTIEFSVKDTGIGIAANELEKIFERFTQIEGNKFNSKEGTGLGLTISKNLVEMQGGKIWVKSELGKGSVFAFSISYNKALSVPKVKVIERISPGEFENFRILVAEDNRVNQFITEAMLQDWGFKIDVASNGKEAVALLERNNYDIILMDIQMPEMNGVEATKIIRAMEDSEKSKIPIIALTANTTRQSHKKFLAEGMTDCLVKPFQEEVLYKKIFSQLKAGGKINQVLKGPRFPLRKFPELSLENLYNLSLLKSDTRNNHEFLIKMLGIFIDTIPFIIIKMQSHFDNNEMDAISTLAHKIKPTLHSVGILSLREVIRNIEEYRDRKRTPEQLKNDLTKLKEVINEVVEAFQKEIIQLKETIE